ncbi:MAG TPA: PilZ domain-containing protein [Terriglobales bacterium]
MEELRSSVRFPIRLPLQVRAANAGQYYAETHDISAGGVLFYMDTELEIGAPVEFSISMPGDVLGTPTDVVVKCVGRVVRCSHEGSRTAVAAVIDEYKFDRGHGPLKHG